MRRLANLIALLGAVVFPGVTTVSALPIRIDLSPTAQIEWDPALGLRPIYSPKTGGFLLFGRAGKSRIQGQLTRIQPDTIATEAGVRRYWQQSVRLAPTGAKASKDGGCRRASAGRFRCVRESFGRGGEASLDVIFWNRDKDLVYIRLSSDSPGASQAALARLRVGFK
jgi:hypothetical protein